MRHRKVGRRLGRDSAHRFALFSNMITSLILHGRIRTTLAKGKELRRMAERVVTLGKRGGEGAAKVHAIRMARRWVTDRDALALLFGEYASRFANRPGGYTRLVRAGFRPGDSAPMAILEFVAADAPAEEVEAEAPAEAEAGSEA
jgi:large subunit ribosomal protein L17